MNISFRQASYTLLTALAISSPMAESRPLKKVAIHELHANDRLKSRQGRGIYILRSSAKKGARRVLIQAGLHGNEKAATMFVDWLVDRFKRDVSPLATIQNVGIDFLPIANPDGVAAGQRYNSQQVNLNRNFSVLWGESRENPGASSFSEPETKAIRALFEGEQYLAAIDVHGYVNWIVAPSRPNVISEVHKSLASLSSRTAYRFLMETLDRLKGEMPTPYKVLTAGELGDGGAFEDWAFWKQGVMSFCLELDVPPPGKHHLSKNYHQQFISYERGLVSQIRRMIAYDSEQIAVDNQPNQPAQAEASAH